MSITITLAALHSPGISQESLWERVGTSTAQQIGIFSDNVGDIDGDGCDDLVQVNYVPLPPLCFEETHLEFVSGRDGSVIRRRRGGDRNLLPFAAVARAGDVDADGVPDYAVCIIDQVARQRTLEVRSASDDRLIWATSSPIEESLGVTLLGDLDLDGDGRPDLITGAPLARTIDPMIQGKYIAFSSRGVRLYEVPSNSSLFWYFCCSARSSGRVGDLDMDGCDDYVVGAAVAPGSQGGAAVVLSGRNGTVISIGLGDPGDFIGYSVEGLGDIDGDGLGDFASGNGGDSFVPRGVVHAFSGRTGARIHSWIEPRRVQYFGEALASGFDADQDGINDILISSGEEHSPGGTGVLRCYSGRDASTLFTLQGLGSCGYYDLVSMGTQPGHPYPVFALSNRCYVGSMPCGSRSGRVRLYRTSPIGLVPLGSGCTGTLPTAPLCGLSERGAAGLRLALSGASPSGAVGLFLGFSSTSIGTVPLPFALDLLGFPGCSLFTSSEYAFTRRAGTSGLDSGTAFVDLPEPYLTSSVPGLTVHGQWIVLGVSGGPGATSNAMSWTYR